MRITDEDHSKFQTVRRRSRRRPSRIKRERRELHEKQEAANPALKHARDKLREATAQLVEIERVAAEKVAAAQKEVEAWRTHYDTQSKSTLVREK